MSKYIKAAGLVLVLLVAANSAWGAYDYLETDPAVLTLDAGQTLPVISGRLLVAFNNASAPCQLP